MSDLVDASDIERIVGVPRHTREHFARAVSAEKTVYILHSHECRDSGIDLRDCPWSLALDRGIDIAEWVEDQPVRVRVRAGRLVPGPVSAGGEDR